jgi:hypothetical protein
VTNVAAAPTLLPLLLPPPLHVAATALLLLVQWANLVISLW